MKGRKALELPCRGKSGLRMATQGVTPLNTVSKCEFLIVLGPVEQREGPGQ